METRYGYTDEAIVNDEGNPVLMPSPTREGYTFSGWYDNDGLNGNICQYYPTAYPAGVTTYYAKWTGLPQTVRAS